MKGFAPGQRQLVGYAYAEDYLTKGIVCNTLRKLEKNSHIKKERPMQSTRFLKAVALSVFSFVLLMVLALPALSEEFSSGLVSTDWLETNLSKENMIIIDIRGDIRDYWRGHIPGAVYFHAEALRLADRGVPGMLMPPGALATMLGKMGVNGNVTVIVYAEQSDYKAPYLIWALDYLGHPSHAMLEGGFDKWQKEKRAVSQDYPKINPVPYTLPARLNHEVRATLEDVKSFVSKGNGVLLDVRPAELYAGEKGFWKRKGHIKGAIHHFWGEDLNDDGTWKSEEELRKAYQEIGATPDKTIIVSCGQGLMSAHTYFALKYLLGYPQVENYDGGFNQWSNLDELPVEVGSGENR